MILFFAGPHKNGTHFQLLVVTEALKAAGREFEIVGDLIFDETRRFQGEPAESRPLLEELDRRRDGRLHICKAHWGTKEQRDLLLSLDEIRVFLIWRDMRDVLVSSYHFRQKRFGEPYADFEEFYWRDGRSLVLRQAAYEASWRQVESDSRVLSSSYEELVRDFPDAAPPILRHAGVDQADLESLREQLSIGALRERFDDREGFLFRRGKVGEHREGIRSEKILEDIDRLRGLSRLPNRLLSVWLDPRVLTKAHFGFPARRALRAGLRGLGRLRSGRRHTAGPSSAGG